MIVEQIAKAKQDKQKIISKSLIIIVLVLLLSALLLFVISNYQLVNNDQSDPDLLNPTVDTTLAENRPGIELSTETAANSAESRQAYLEAFIQFENNLEPALNSINIAKWNKTLSDKLTMQKSEAIKAFSQGNYSTAMQNMAELINTAEKAISDSSKAFEHAMQQAESSYSANDYPAARLAIDTALLHDALSETAQVLSKKIDNIPQIASLDEAILVARIENNPLKEIALIEQLLHIDSSRTELQQRVVSLHSMQSEIRFKKAVNQASKAIKAGQSTSAKQALKRAKSIYSSHADVIELTQALAILESQQRFDNYQTQGDAASHSDNWITAKQKYEKALTEKPSDSLVVDKLAKASRIVTMSADIAKLLHSPDRLSNTQVKTRAELTLIKASKLFDSSPSLALSASQLKSVLTAANSLIPVTVHSDGHTFVQLRGVGVIGITTSKVITLKPGSYKFEGKRDGYKSKIIAVIIPLNKSSFQVTVVADERI